MNQQEIIEFVLEKLRENWNAVFKSASSILSVINENGFNFDQVDSAANPSITQIIVILKQTNDVFSAMETILPHLNASSNQRYEFERTLLNSRQMVLHMEQIMLAMQKGDDEECLRLQQILKTQACI